MREYGLYSISLKILSFLSLKINTGENMSDSFKRAENIIRESIMSQPWQTVYMLLFLIYLKLQYSNCRWIKRFNIISTKWIKVDKRCQLFFRRGKEWDIVNRFGRMQSGKTFRMGRRCLQNTATYRKLRNGMLQSL